MKRFRKSIINGLTLLSLLLFLATVVLWIASRWGLMLFSVDSQSNDVFYSHRLAVYPNYLMVQRVDERPLLPTIKVLYGGWWPVGFPDPRMDKHRITPKRARGVFLSLQAEPYLEHQCPEYVAFLGRYGLHLPGLFYAEIPYSTGVWVFRSRSLAIHCVWIVVLTAALPAWWLLKTRRKPQVGKCPSCGYDLRASPGDDAANGHQSQAGATTAK